MPGPRGAIERDTAALDPLAFGRGPVVQDAPAVRPIVCGAALNRPARLDAAVGSTLPDLPRIVALRSKVAHADGPIDDEILWGVVGSNIPMLRRHRVQLVDACP